MPAFRFADGSTVEYTLRRSARRRSIGLRINEQGLSIAIPSRLSLRALEDLLHSKQRWIAEKLQHYREIAVPALQWQHGDQLYLFGQPLLLDIADDARDRALRHEDGRLIVRLRVGHDRSKVQHKCVQWLRQQALADFTRRTALLAQKLQVPMPPVALSSARSRWGSCNHKGEIRLNWRLVQAPPHIIQYVVAHELAHLKEMNHSQRFWAIVDTLFPGYPLAEADLKNWSRQLHAVD